MYADKDSHTNASHTQIENIKRDNHRMNERRSIEVIKSGRPKKLACSLAVIKSGHPKKFACSSAVIKNDCSSLSRSSYDLLNVQKDLQKADTKKSSQKYYQS